MISSPSSDLQCQTKKLLLSALHDHTDPESARQEDIVQYTQYALDRMLCFLIWDKSIHTHTHCSHLFIALAVQLVW